MRPSRAWVRAGPGKLGRIQLRVGVIWAFQVVLRWDCRSCELLWSAQTRLMGPSRLTSSPKHQDESVLRQTANCFWSRQKSAEIESSCACFRRFRLEVTVVTLGAAIGTCAKAVAYGETTLSDVVRQSSKSCMPAALRQSRPAPLVFCIAPCPSMSNAGVCGSLWFARNRRLSATTEAVQQFGCRWLPPKAATAATR